MQQLVEEILRNPDDKTQVTLMFANNVEEDILLRQRFDKLASKHDNFKVHYVLSEPPEGWTGGSGHVDQDDISAHCPPPGSDNLVCVRCPGMSMHMGFLMIMQCLDLSCKTCAVAVHSRVTRSSRSLQLTVPFFALRRARACAVRCTAATLTDQVDLAQHR